MIQHEPGESYSKLYFFFKFNGNQIHSFISSNDVFGKIFSQFLFFEVKHFCLKYLL